VTRPGREAVLAGALLALAAALRLWDIADRPGFEWDEPVYAEIGASVALGDGLQLKASEGVAGAPYLYHPPFHFLLLGGWFRVAGDGVAQARVIAALASVAVLGLLYVLMHRRWAGWALIPLVLLVVDGWLVFSNRIGQIENAMLVLGVAGMLLYDQALRTSRMRWFLAAGAMIGAACAYKHVAAYLLVAVAITWLVLRSHHREHAALLGVAALVVAAYVAAMTAIFRADFVDATIVQVERLTGHKDARGSIGDPGQALDALVGPYSIYAPTLALCCAAGLLLVRRTVVLLRRGAVADPLLFGWAAAAVVWFAAMGLRMGHYFMLVEIPLYLFLASELLPAARRLERRSAAVAVAAAALLLVANLGAVGHRMMLRSDNALAAVQRYADGSLPPRALVLTEEPVGTMIRQPYCKFHRVGACESRVGYVILYRSFTQRPPDDPRLAALVARSRPLARFDGWRERIVVLEVENRPSIHSIRRASQERRNRTSARNEPRAAGFGQIRR
jgi:4-amino-4-deoxy-L-arabinose transferase-like glycosyltransferase